MSLLFKSILVISLLTVGSLLFTTANDLVAKANPRCDQANQRTISLRVENKAGALVDNLRLEDLSLLENKASREILKLESKTNEFVAVAILIDKSVSQERLLPQTKLAAQEFFEAVLLTNKDRVALVSFTGEVTVDENLTNDLAKLKSAIDRIKFVPVPGYVGGGVVVSRMPPPNPPILGSSAIWDAVWVSTDGILQTAADSRRGIVLLTDGEDTSSSKRLREAIEYADRYDVAVFAIGVADERASGPVNRNPLKRLSEETGGRAFFPKKLQELPNIFQQVEQELRARYLVTYCSASTGPADKPTIINFEMKTPQSRESDFHLLYQHYGL